ncbi:hypothetical protein E4U57_007138 [Claviceps arundinis]|uniref:Uncharacterized protein n=1 Tax=Claviceps arundinis TaxID=1623583 RepID=A0ABQ7P181_9HYPO|nr:hypothetical protein E4U57_007138 [Claviceps arundinis]
MADDDDEIGQPKKPKMDPRFNEQGDLVTDDGNDYPEANASPSLQQLLQQQQAEIANTTAKLQAAQDIATKLQAAHAPQLDNSGPRASQSSPTSDICTWMPDSFHAIGITDDQIRRCISDLSKLYKDSDKYSGERYHFMARKFDTFKDRCRRLSIPPVLWARAFPIMLRSGRLLHRNAV